VNPNIAGPVLGDRTGFRPSSFLKRSNPGIEVAEFAQDGISSSHVSSSLDSETLSLISLLTSWDSPVLSIIEFSQSQWRTSSVLASKDSAGIWLARKVLDRNREIPSLSFIPAVATIERM
jgi:hypothetical protein